MAVYPYTGRLTDFGESPFPDAFPRLWVYPQQDAFSPSGPAASKRIPVPLAADGAFSVVLTASIDLVPPTPYTLRCEWISSSSDPNPPRYWAEWGFTAQPGGGPIATMPGVMTRVWYDTSPPPVNRAGIYWVHPTTGDVRVWSD